MTARAALADLRASASAVRAAGAQRYFRTGIGEYGEGDHFLGVVLPDLRRLARKHAHLSLADCRALLASRHHEARLLALLVMGQAYEHGGERERAAIYRLYLDSTDRINNWDLVDCSAPQVVGRHLLERSRAPLRRLARSKSLWERRIAIVATHRFIRNDEFEDTLAIADLLLHDEHDLIHKATGWMLREVGKRDRAALERFLKPRYAGMPRTMLRYAIERFPERLRQRYLRGRI